MKLEIRGLLAGLALIAGIGPASAAIVTDTYVGTTDQISFPDANTGQQGVSYEPFVATFTFDLSQAGSQRFTTSDYDEIFSSYPATFGTASFTINNQTVYLTGSSNALNFIYNDGVFPYISSDVYDSSGLYLSVSNYLPITITPILTTEIPNSTNTNIYYNITNYLSGLEGTYFDSNTGKDVRLFPESVSVSVSSSVSAVPLPAALPMFATALLALGGIGAWWQRRTASNRRARLLPA